MKKHLTATLAAAAMLLCAGTGCSSDRGVDDFTSGLNALKDSSAADEPSATDAPAVSDVTAPESSEASIQTQSAGSTVLYDWTDTGNWDWQTEDGAAATIKLLSSDDNTLMIDTTDPGPNPWSVQGKYTGIRLEQGCTYRLSFEYKSELWGTGAGYDPSAHHALVTVLQNYEPYDPYYETTLRLDRSDFYSVSFDFEMREPTDSNVFVAFSFGGLGKTGCTAQIRHFKLERLSR